MINWHLLREVVDSRPSKALPTLCERIHYIDNTVLTTECFIDLKEDFEICVRTPKRMGIGSRSHRLESSGYMWNSWEFGLVRYRLHPTR